MKITIDAGLIGLVWVLGLGAVATSLSLIIFDLIRPRITQVFDRRRHAWSAEHLGFPLDDGRHHSPPQPSHAPLAWISYVWRMPDHQIKQTHGVDSIMTLRFSRVMGKLFATLSFFSAAVLIPLYATGANKNLSKKNRLRVFGIRIISFANIPKNDTRRMAFVFVADVLISLYILYFLSAEFRYLVRVRREHRISHHPSNYAILVQNIPTHYAKKDQLYQFFESLFPKGVQQVIPIPAGAKISKYRREYFDAVRQRQRAEAVLRNAQIDELTKQISESSFEAERGIFPESFAPASRLRMLLPALSNLFGRSSSSNSNETSLPFPGAPAPPLDLPGSPMQQPALQKKSSLTDKIKLPNALKNWRDPQQ